MLIRAFNEDDENAIVELSLRAWAPVVPHIHEQFGPELIEVLEPDWETKQANDVRETLKLATVWVAADDEHVHGFVAAHLHDDRRIGEIDMIAVDPAFQRRGVATALLQQAFAWIKEQGVDVAMLGTGSDPGHAPARAAYENSGMKLITVARYFKRL